MLISNPLILQSDLFLLKSEYHLGLLGFASGVPQYGALESFAGSITIALLQILRSTRRVLVPASSIC